MGRTGPAGQATTIRRAMTVLLTAAISLAACSSPPPPPPPTVAQVKLIASSDVNPAQSGSGAPVVVRVYQLASPAAFDKAEFFPLLNGDAAALGQDLVKRDEYLMAPSTTKEASVTVPDRVMSIGVFAAYRQFQTKVWRLDVALPPHKTTPVTIRLGADGLVAEPGP